MRSFSLAFGLAFGLALALLMAPSLRGDTTGAKERLSPQAASALEFAKTHHPELASLLEQLRVNAPKDFDAAVTDLNRTRERLERSRKNTPERYELELVAWKLDSRVRLLAARLAMGGDPGLEEELRDALEERFDVRIKLLKDERDRLHKRVGRLDEQIAEQERRADEILNREFAALRAPKSEPRKPAARDAAASGRKKDSAKQPSKDESAKGPSTGKPNPPKTDAPKP